MLKAKPVLPDHYWILTDQDRKVGTITAQGRGFSVTIRGHSREFNTLRTIRKQLDVEIDPLPAKKKISTDEIYGFQVTGKIYNAMWHVHYRLPLYTKSPKSRSWYAAGWYAIKQNRTWKICRSPKLIVLQRYAFQGPFHTREEAHDKSIS